MNISHNSNMYKQLMFILHLFTIKSGAHCTQQLYGWCYDSSKWSYTCTRSLHIYCIDS